MPTFVPVDHDPFAAAAPAPTLGVKFVPVDHDPFAEPSVVADVAKSGGVGLVKGVTGIAGGAGSFTDLVGNNADYYLQRGLKAAGLVPAGVEPQKYEDIVHENRVLSKGSTILPRTDEINTALQQDFGEFHKPQTTAGRFAETVGEFVPGAALMPGSVATNMARSAVLPGVASEAAGEATEGTKFEPYARIGAAVMAPGAVGAVRRAVTPLPIPPERQAMVNTLRSENIPLTAGQATGNKKLRQLEDALGTVSYSKKGVHAVDQAQKAAFTKATLRGIGLDASNASSDALASAKAALGAGFNRVSARNTVNLDHAFASDLGRVLDEYESLIVPGTAKPIVQKTVDGLAQIGDQVPGKSYQAMRSNLDKAGRAVKQSDPPLSQALFGVRNALDGAMTRSVSPADAAEWGDLRNKWKNWKVVEKTAGRAGEEAQGGNISPAALRSAAVGQNRGAYAVGQGDYGDLARAGEAIMSPLKSSGTAERMHTLHALSVLGGGVGGYMGGAGGFAAGGLAPLVAPSILDRVLMSRTAQGYLGNQLLAGEATPPSVLERLLLSNTARQHLPAERSR